ncbi:DnaD domain-containing protein [Ectobacillus ponti]|uniref:DnaD domain protein n=1 Tax=Ectobacillus ponti TaxID=2961894 RepID=A0AA41X7G2_9BACI|nr:DnaD domain protein [Ectobacillus ponti]MCP8970147.1 DnaD domain protein [Ectobacillus ponti]
MAVYRPFRVGFWQEDFTLELTPEERYFYFYLLTGTKTTQCGIYTLPKRLAELETGYQIETVEKLLVRFMEYGKILYDAQTKEVYICDWIFNNAITNVNVEKCVLRELKTVKSELFRQLYLQDCTRLGLDVPLLREHFGQLQVVPAPVPAENEEAEETEAAEQNDSSGVFQFYQEHFGTLSSYAAQELGAWIDDLSAELVLRAMQVAYERNGRNMAYIKAILRDWHSKGYTTLAEVEQALARHQKKEQPVAEWQEEAYENVPSEGELQQLLGEKGWRP